MKILLTGGTGYIGSHTAVELLALDYEVVLVDNLQNSKSSVVERIFKISGKHPSFINLDVADEVATSRLLQREKPDAVMHFAGLKEVARSVADPLLYYQQNLTTSISLCSAMAAVGISNLVFSSSATVYGHPERIPLDEACIATKAFSPYGQTKIMIEQILKDLSAARPEFNIVILRYFNPAGAHPSAMIGEDPTGIPSNLVPFITQVASGQRKELIINGDNYLTKDGTCIRDYIHIQDLASGHIAAIQKLQNKCGLVTYNLGTGKGISVKEVVSEFEAATNQKVPKSIGKRREGDVPSYYTDPSLAEKELKWKTNFTIADICQDAWRWQVKNPTGYP